jgi:hypothetical protein
MVDSSVRVFMIAQLAGAVAINVARSYLSLTSTWGGFLVRPSAAARQSG